MINEPKWLTVGLLWHSVTSDNLGVGALTLAQMALISEASHRRGACVRFVVIGTRGGTPYEVDGMAILGSAEFALRAFRAWRFDAITLLRQCDVVFDIGEGDSFSDIYGSKRLMIQVFAKMLVRAFGKPLVLSPQTIGPFNSRTGRLLASIGLHSATRVFARDQLSMSLLQETGFADRAHEVIDVAFALPFTRPLRHNYGRIRVGVNVSGLLYSGGYDGANRFRLTVDYPKLIERVCELLLAMPDIDVYLVPHVISDTSEIEDDFRASEKLVQRYPLLKMAPRFRSPVEAKSFISGMDFFTGARMHACIAAFSSGVPVVPMAYSRKFNGLFNSLGYPHVIDCLQITTDEGVRALMDAVSRRMDLAIDVERGNKLARRKLDMYVDAIAELLPQ